MPSTILDLSSPEECSNQANKTCHASSSFQSSIRSNNRLLPLTALHIDHSPSSSTFYVSSRHVPTLKQEPAIQHVDAFCTQPRIVDVQPSSAWQSRVPPSGVANTPPISSLSRIPSIPSSSTNEPPNILNYKCPFPKIGNLGAFPATSHPLSVETGWMATSAHSSHSPTHLLQSQFPSRWPFKRASTIVHHLKSRWSNSRRLKRSKTLEGTTTQENPDSFEKMAIRTEDLVTSFGAYRLRVD